MCASELSELLDAILRRATVSGISKARLADKAGIRPETQSRLRGRDNADLKTVVNLALAAGLRLSLSPLDSDEAAVYSPAGNAAAKRAARARAERERASGKVSAQELHRRSSVFAFPKARFEIKGLRAGKG